MSDKKHHWLTAGQVIVSSPKGSRQRGVNTLTLTGENRITRVDIASAQQALMRRILTESALGKNEKISDVFVIGFSYLGLMTEEEFEAGFVEALAEEAAAPTQAN